MVHEVGRSMESGDSTAQMREAMSGLLGNYFCREYLHEGENLMPRRGAMSHLTLFVDWPHETVGPLARRASIHIYGIAANSFMLELRNLPTSVSIEKFILRVGGAIDDGQRHTTARLEIGPSDGPLVRELAELVRRVPREGRIDRFAGFGSGPSVVREALLRLARLLEAFEAEDIEGSAAMVVCQRQWGLKAW